MPEVLMYQRDGYMCADLVNRPFGNSSSITATLPLFTYDLTSSRDHQHYSGVIVGRNAFKGGGAVGVSTYIVPLIIKTHLVATGINQNGILSTAGGTTVFNSTIADPHIGSTNNIPVKLVQQSPFVQAANINFGGTMVGRTQYLDAFQRPQFLECHQSRHLPRQAEPGPHAGCGHHLTCPRPKAFPSLPRCSEGMVPSGSLTSISSAATWTTSFCRSWSRKA